MSKVIDLAEAKRERVAQGKKRHGTLQFRLDKQGCLNVKELNAKGGVIAEWDADRANTKILIERLQHDLRRFELAAYYEANPEARPKPQKPRAWHRCSLNRDNTLGGSMGCTRRSAHEGAHRDKNGEWTAPFPHHRFCSAAVYGAPPDGSERRAVKVPDFAQALIGPVSWIYVMPNGRCRSCGNRVDPELVVSNLPEPSAGK